MLKIKDSVNLKELEKFGFVQSLNPKTMYKEDVYEWNHLQYGNEYQFQVIVNPNNKKIDRELTGCFNACDDEIDVTFDLDTLYKLIKADLVEEVSNE